MNIADQFDRASGRYDLLTRLNPGYHGALREAAENLVARVGRDGGTGLWWDLGCGSGLSTRALVAALGPAAATATIVGLDASEGMLDEARTKRWPAGVRFVHAAAQALPQVAAREVDRPADGVLAAYLLRNVPADQRDAVVEAIAAQVRPGGWIALQDYHVAGPGLAREVARTVWTAVCWGIVTPLSAIVRGNPAIYRYLWRSVLHNDSVEVLEQRLRSAGFVDISWSTAGGWQHGILHTVLARRPEDAR